MAVQMEYVFKMLMNCNYYTEIQEKNYVNNAIFKTNI